VVNIQGAGSPKKKVERIMKPALYTNINSRGDSTFSIEQKYL
jgi:hypothetical protein